MTRRDGLLRFEEKLAGERAFLENLREPEHERFVRNAILGAAIIHTVVLLLPPLRLSPPRVPEAGVPERAVIWRDIPEEADRVASVADAGSAPLRLSSAPAAIAFVPVPEDPIPEPARELPGDLLAAEVDALLGQPDSPPATDGLSDPSDADTTPAHVLEGGRVEPDFPEPARSRHLTGSVVLRVEVLATGAVGEVAVVQSSRPNVGFERAAVRAVRQWKFRPAMRNGTSIDSHTVVKVEFQ